MILIVSAFFIFLADGINVYAPSAVPSAYNQSFVAIKEQLDSISNLTNATNTALKVKPPTNPLSGILDFIGFFFSAGYQALQIAVQSVNLNVLMVSQATDVIVGGTEYGNLLKAVGLVLLLIVIIIGILMSIIFKWET